MEIFQLNFKNINLLIPGLGPINDIPINETRMDYLFKASAIPLIMSLSTLLFYKPPSTFAWFVCLLFGVVLTVIGTVIQAELSAIKDNPAVGVLKYVTPLGEAVMGLMVLIYIIRYVRLYLQRKKDKQRMEHDPNYKPQQKMEDIDNFEAISNDVAFLKKPKLKMFRMFFVGAVTLAGFAFNLSRVINRESDAYDTKCIYGSSQVAFGSSYFQSVSIIDENLYLNQRSQPFANHFQDGAPNCFANNIEFNPSGYNYFANGTYRRQLMSPAMSFNNQTNSYQAYTNNNNPNNNNNANGNYYNSNEENDRNFIIVSSETFEIYNGDGTPNAQYSKCCFNTPNRNYESAFIPTVICGPIAFLCLLNFFGSLSKKGRKIFTKLNSFIRKSSLKVVLIVLALTYMPITTVLFKFLICSEVTCGSGQQVKRHFSALTFYENPSAAITPRIDVTLPPITPNEIKGYCEAISYDTQCPADIGFQPDITDSLLTIDPTLSCNSEIRPYFLPGALLLLVVFSLGVPYLYYRLVKLVNEFLLKIRVMESATNEWLVKIKASKNSCAQMYNSFESKWKYFKLALIVYRLMIVSCFVFLITLNFRSTAIIAICCIHCVAILFAIYSRSYYHKSNQFVVYAIIGMNIIACALVISGSNGGGGVSDSLLYPTSVLNFLIPISAFLVGYILDKRQAKKLLKAQKGKDIEDEESKDVIVQKTTEIVNPVVSQPISSKVVVKEEPALERKKTVKESAVVPDLKVEKLISPTYQDESIMGMIQNAEDDDGIPEIRVGTTLCQQVTSSISEERPASNVRLSSPLKISEGNSNESVVRPLSKESSNGVIDADQTTQENLLLIPLVQERRNSTKSVKSSRNESVVSKSDLDNEFKVSTDDDAQNKGTVNLEVPEIQKRKSTMSKSEAEELKDKTTERKATMSIAETANLKESAKSETQARKTTMSTVEADKIKESAKSEIQGRKSTMSKIESENLKETANLESQARKSTMSAVDANKLKETSQVRKSTMSKQEADIAQENIKQVRKGTMSKVEADDRKSEFRENSTVETQNRKSTLSKNQATKKRGSEIKHSEPIEETAEDLKKVKKRLHLIVKEDREKIKLMDMVLDRKILKLVLNYFVVLAVSSCFALSFGVIAIYTQKSFRKVSQDSRGFGAITSTEFGNFTSWNDFSNNCCCITTQSNETAGFEVWRCKNNNLFQYKVICSFNLEFNSYQTQLQFDWLPNSSILWEKF